MTPAAVAPSIAGPTILVVDDEESIRVSLSRMLRVEGYRADAAESGEVALARLAQPDSAHPIQLVLLDVMMPGGISGIEVLERLRTSHPGLPVVMMSGHSTVETAVQALRSGAVDFIEKPLASEKILVTIANALRLHHLEAENATLRGRLADRYSLIGDAPNMAAVWQRIERAAPTQGSVLVTGESGTGKELVARAVHERSRRLRGPFVKLNCAAIPSDLIESELFGHERGAFTGAVGRKLGKFEAAHTGTLFLDEIGDMHLDAQAKLLRVLQEGELERVGGTATIQVDVRIVAATNKDLPEAIAQGEFREDLYYRINVIPIELPPLRDRRGDIPALVQHFLLEAAARHDLPLPRLDAGAMQRLLDHDYPGNVRELRNLVERLVILGGQELLGAADVEAVAFTGPRRAAQGLYVPGVPLKDLVAQAERAIIEAALEYHDGHMTRTAAALQLERSHLYKKLKALGLRQTGE